MSPGFSVYLDAARVLAACVVVLCHFGGQRIGGGALWQVGPYGAQAVDLFFVLSGLVIAASLDRPGQTPRHFAIARAARIYSVAAPALLLTLLLDTAGYRINPGAYLTVSGAVTGAPPHWLQGCAGLLFFGQAWGADIPIGGNVPWWSLGYEVPYYAAFGLFTFGRGVWRWLGPAAVLAAEGPGVALLALGWLAGPLVWRTRSVVLPRGGAWALAVVPPLLWLGYEVVAWRVGRLLAPAGWFRAEAPQDLLVCALFALHLAGMVRLLGAGRGLPRATPVIRFLAGRSFTLYLFHFPLLLFMRAVCLRYWPGLSPFVMLPVMAVLVLGLAEVTERRRGWWRRVFMRVF